MATHCGSEGSVAVGADTVAEVRNYSIEESADTIEDTALGDTARTFKLGLEQWTASLDVWWDETDTNGQGALPNGAAVTLNVYPEGDDSSDTYLTGSGIVTGLSISGSFDGMVEASITIQGTGALTTTTVA
jgi:predicted secreted protein